MPISFTSFNPERRSIRNINGRLEHPKKDIEQLHISELSGMYIPSEILGRTQLHMSQNYPQRIKMLPPKGITAVDLNNALKLREQNGNGIRKDDTILESGYKISRVYDKDDNLVKTITCNKEDKIVEEEYSNGVIVEWYASGELKSLGTENDFKIWHPDGKLFMEKRADGYFIVSDEKGIRERTPNGEITCYNYL